MSTPDPAAYFAEQAFRFAAYARTCELLGNYEQAFDASERAAWYEAEAMKLAAPRQLTADRPVTLVYASGSRPQACKYGHPWTAGSGHMLVSWVLCECEGARSNPSGYGHHQIRCLGGDGKCPSIWRDPPHTPAADQL